MTVSFFLERPLSSAPDRAQRARTGPHLASGVVQQRGEGHSPVTSHPAFTPQPIQGWTPDFIPSVLQEAVDKHYYDELIPVTGADAIAWSKRLAAEEGIFTGIPGGAPLAVAIQVAQKAPQGAVLCCAACCLTRVNVTCRRRCLKAWPPR